MYCAQMEIPTPDALSQLFQELLQHAADERNDKEKDVKDVGEQRLNHKPASPQTSHKKPGKNTLITLSQKCDDIALVRDFVVEALTLHSKLLMAPLWNYRNQMVTVGRLPIEILSLIFDFVAAFDVPDSSQKLEKRSAYCISLVSKRWREVALDTPALWTYIDPINRNIAFKCLLRSKTAPFNIRLWAPRHISHCTNHDGKVCKSSKGATSMCCSEYNRYTRDFLSPLTTHTDRWRSLEMCMGHQYLQMKELQFPAPRLEKLYLKEENEMMCWTGMLGVTPLRKIFDGHTPRLRNLHFDGFHLPLLSPIYSGLTHLSLERIVYRFTFLSTDTPLHLLHILRACPMLQELELNQVSFHVIFTDPDCPVALPHLSHMRLIDLGDLAKYILTHTQSPPSMRLEVDTMIEEGDGSGLNIIFPPLPILVVSLPSVLQIRSLEIEWYGFLDIRASDGISDDSLAVFFTSIPPESVDHIIYEIAEDLSLEFLESLSITCDVWDRETVAAVVSMLHNLPTLTSLSLGRCPSLLMQAFIVSDPDPHPCPALHTLRLTHSRVHGDTLLEVVLSRSRPHLHETPSPLRVIELLKCPNIFLDEDSELARDLALASVQVVRMESEWPSDSEYDSDEYASDDD